MIRTAAIVILGICLLAAAGWGAFATYHLQEQEKITRSYEYQCDELKQANTYISNQFNEVESELFAAQLELQTTQNKVSSLEVENAELNQANTYISNLFLLAESENRRLNDQVTDLNNQVIEQGGMLEAAEQYFYQLQSELEAATFELGKDMPVKPTEARWFDCDDSALYMFYYFTNMGYEVDIVKGNLELTGEWRLGCDHLWVVVHSNGVVYPYDWGEYCPDSQHHEYYKIGFTELILAAGIG